MKALLLNDLCARLPHGVLLRLPDGSIKKLVIKKTNPSTQIFLEEAMKIDGIKPILYPVLDVFTCDESDPIPVGVDWKNPGEIKKVTPIIELAKRLVPDAVTHKILKNGVGVISTLRKTKSNPYPISFTTTLSKLLGTVEGIDLCYRYHLDCHNLIKLGLAEKILKSVQYKIIKSPYETENKI